MHPTWLCARLCLCRDPASREFYLEGGAMVLADGGVVSACTIPRPPPPGLTCMPAGLPSAVMGYRRATCRQGACTTPTCPACLSFSRIGAP